MCNYISTGKDFVDIINTFFLQVKNTIVILRPKT